MLELLGMLEMLDSFCSPLLSIWLFILLFTVSDKGFGLSTLLVAMIVVGDR